MTGSCPTCGSPLNEEGLCARCLLEIGLEWDDSGPPTPPGEPVEPAAKQDKEPVPSEDE